ncbi:MAG: TolC family protein [Sulfurimonas sp.]|uniref:TolC family protein n=1 Tax=Sulfurimonas sp. TaxID=2022749 RepID=UPI0025DFE1B8|nr:TolC family protein [Sulfurimonas sp.]MCK9490564.1 TolC family protein [Sulfurimonas sp.]
MKNSVVYFIIFHLLAFISLSADDKELLSQEKQNLLLQEQNRYESEYEKLRYNWITPLNLGASYGYDKAYTGDYGTNTNVSASISQDIFRSGGITYQIEYADAKKRTDEISLSKEMASINEQLFTTLLDYKKTLYQKEQSELILKNKEIEIFIKRQLYDVGKADITELNNALVAQSSELKNLVTHQYMLAKLRGEVLKLSDVDPAKFLLPTFTLIERDAYLENNLNLNYLRFQAKSYESLYGVTKSNYLPSVTLNANVGYREYDSKKYENKYDGNYYGAGVTLNIPLTYNADATTQEAKASYLKQAAQVADTYRITKASYTQSIELIESYRSYNEITSKNLSLYDELIEAIEAGVNTGEKTGYDLQIIKNTKAIEKLNIKLSEINIQIELAKLHFALNFKDRR